MNTGIVNPITRTFDLGLYNEVDTSLHVNTSKISWMYRDEDSNLVKYIKTIPNPTVGETGDYLTSSGVLEVIQPFALNGYFPLYLTNFAAAAVNSTYHEHSINGKVYFMPD